MKLQRIAEDHFSQKERVFSASNDEYCSCKLGRQESLLRKKTFRPKFVMLIIVVKKDFEVHANVWSIIWKWAPSYHKHFFNCQHSIFVRNWKTLEINPITCLVCLNIKLFVRINKAGIPKKWLIELFKIAKIWSFGYPDWRNFWGKFF